VRGNRLEGLGLWNPAGNRAYTIQLQCLKSQIAKAAKAALKPRGFCDPEVSGTRKKKTSRELADMVASGIGICDVAVVVHGIRLIGWYPTSMTAPAQAIGVELRADQVAKDASGSRWPTIGGIF
jgi:hypothetical protein